MTSAEPSLTVSWASEQLAFLRGTRGPNPTISIGETWSFDSEQSALEAPSVETSSAAAAPPSLFIMDLKFPSASDDANVNKVSIESNARNLEIYSWEARAAMGGGSLPAAWSYLATVRGTPVDSPSFDGHMIAKCEFSAPKAPRTPLRFKLLSLKPNKQKLVLGRVTVSVDPPAAAPPTTAANDSSSSTSSNVMLGATAGATIGTGISASMASSSSSSSSGQLSGILQTAMLQMDTKIHAACGQLEFRLNHRLAALEGTVNELGRTVHGLSNEQQRLYQEQQGLKQQQMSIASSLTSASAAGKSAAADASVTRNSGTPVNERTGAEAYAWVSGLGPNFASSHAESLALLGCLDSGETLLSLTEDDLASDELGIPPEDANLLMNALKQLMSTENTSSLVGDGKSSDNSSGLPPTPPPPSAELAAALASGLSPVTTTARYAVTETTGTAESGTTDAVADATASDGGADVATTGNSRTPVNEWTGAEAYAWVSGLGPNFASSHAESLALLGCLDSGETLLSLTEDDLASDELGIPPEDARVLLDALTNLMIPGSEATCFIGKGKCPSNSSGLPPAPPPPSAELAAALASGLASD